VRGGDDVADEGGCGGGRVGGDEQVVVAGFFVWGKEGDEESENEFSGERGRLCGDVGEDSGEGDFSVVNVEGHCQLKAVCV
jgi:hypothetical protein